MSNVDRNSCSRRDEVVAKGSNPARLFHSRVGHHAKSIRKKSLLGRRQCRRKIENKRNEKQQRYCALSLHSRIPKLNNAFSGEFLAYTDGEIRRVDRALTLTVRFRSMRRGGKSGPNAEPRL